MVFAPPRLWLELGQPHRDHSVDRRAERQLHRLRFALVLYSCQNTKYVWQIDALQIDAEVCLNISKGTRYVQGQGTEWRMVRTVVAQ